MPLNLQKSMCLVAGFALVSASNFAWSATLTKQEALKIMKNDGVRWQQTKLLVDEAESLSIQAEAAEKLHGALVGRQLATKADLTRFGLMSTGPADIVTFGSVVAELEYSILDRKAFERSRAARAGVAISEVQRDQYRSDLMAGMAFTYLGAQKWAQKVLVIKSSIERDSEIVKMAEAKVKSGTGITIDLLRAKGLVALDNTKLLDAETNYRKALQDLAVFLGRASLDDEVEPLVLRTISIDIDDPFAKTGIDDRSDVKVSLETLEAARSLKREAVSEKWPTITAFAEGGMGASNEFPGTGISPVGAVGIQFKAPFLDGGYFGAKEKQAETNVQKAQLQAQHVRLQAQGEIKAALEQLKTSHAAADLAVEQVNLATRELEIASKRFSSGSTSGADLATSQGNLSNAVSTEIDIIYAYELSKLNYFKSIGDLEAFFSPESSSK